MTSVSTNQSDWEGRLAKFPIVVVRYVYVFVLLAVSIATVIAVLLRWLAPELQQGSIFDPVIGWIGLALTLVSISPFIFSTWIGIESRYIVYASILALFTYQLFVIVRVIVSRDFGIDFRNYFESAMMLYGKEQSPYSLPPGVAVAFPFPSYLIYWLISLGGRLSIGDSFLIYCGLNLVLWVSLNVILWHHFRLDAGSNLVNGFIILCILNSTGWESFLGLGQTTVIILFLIVLMLMCFRKQQNIWWFGGGALLALAIMIKAQLLVLLIGLGILFLSRIKNARPSFNVPAALLGVAVTVMILIPVSLFFPPGLTLDIYKEWLFEVYPSVNNPAINPYTATFGVIHGNASPIALLVQLTGRLFGLMPSSSLYSVVTVLGIIVFAGWIYRHIDIDLPLEDCLLLWLYGTVLLTPLTHTNSVVWVTPAFLVLLRNLFASEVPNSLLVFLATFSFAVLRLQIPILTLASLTILLVLTFKWMQNRHQAVQRFAKNEPAPIRDCLC